MQSLIVALAAALAWTGTGQSADKFAIVPVDVQGKDEPGLADVLLGALEKGTSTDGTEVVRVEQPCSDADCFATIARETGATHVFAATVAVELNDYRVELVAHDATGAARHSIKFDCEICTHADLESRMAQEVTTFRTKLASAMGGPDAVLATISVTTVPSGARVLLDGKPIGTTPFDGEISPGQHALTVEADGYIAETSRFEARLGGQSSFAIALEREVDRDAARPRRLRIAGYTSLGVGLGSLVAGSVLLGIDSRPIQSRCSGDSIDVNGTCEYLHDTMVVGAVLTSVGVAAIVTGVALVITGRPGRKSQARAAATIGGINF
jgi:hypothetical protein